MRFFKVYFPTALMSRKDDAFQRFHSLIESWKCNYISDHFTVYRYQDSNLFSAAKRTLESHEIQTLSSFFKIWLVCIPRINFFFSHELYWSSCIMIYLEQKSTIHCMVGYFPNYNNIQKWQIFGDDEFQRTTTFRERQIFGYDEFFDL